MTVTSNEPAAAAPRVRVRNTANHTTNRSIRISDDVWARALQRAETDQVVLSELVRDFVTRYADGQTDPAAELMARDDVLASARRAVADLATLLEVCE